LGQILNDIVQLFRDATGAWYGELLPIAQNLFFLLALITIVWSAAWWVIERDDLSEVFVSFLKRLLALGFFWALLLNANVWIPAVIDGFATAGQRAASAPSGGTATLNPALILEQGMGISNSVLDSVRQAGILQNLGTAIVGGVSTLVILLAFVVIAAQLVVTLVEMYIVIGAGVILLGFAGSPWTLQFAERYLSYAVAVGIKLFVLYLILGLGSAIVGEYTPTIAQAGLTTDALFVLIAGSLIYMFVAYSIPSFAGSLLGGSVNLTLGSAVRAGVATAAITLGPSRLVAGAAGMLGRSGAHTTAAMAEAGRYGTAHRAEGASIPGSVASAGSVLAASTVAAGYQRLSGQGYATTAAHLRERRIVRFGEPADRGYGYPASAGQGQGASAPSVVADRPAAASPPADSPSDDGDTQSRNT